MQSKSLKIFFAAAFILSMACNKNLTILPQNNITSDQIKTGDDVEAVLGGAYSLLQGPSAFGERFILFPDLLASNDQVDFVGTFTEYKQFYTKTMISDNTRVEYIWDNSYDLINTANIVIDKSSLVDESDRNAVIGEAEFIRGIVYFEMVNLYALPYSAGTSNMGVPIITTPTYTLDTTLNFYVARSSVGDVYSQILKDLQDASAKLPESNGVRATKYSAQAFLARVYMNMGNYSAAALMADSIISSGEYRLVPQYSGEFNNLSNTSEDIFAIQQTAQSNAGTSNSGLTTMYAPTYPDISEASSGRGDVIIDKGYFSYFEPNDFRASYVYTGVSISGHHGTYPEKWYQFYKAIPVVRLAEMYLTRGEANLHAGTSVGATPLDDINTVRERSDASDLTSVSVSDFVDERFRELGFEGDRLNTLRRLKMNVGNLPYNDPTLVVPIPLRDLQVNKNLVQNPGY